MKASSRLTELLRIIIVVVVALLIGFVITSFVSKEPVKAFTALLTGPLPKLSFENGLQIKGINRFGNWLEESITLILAGLAVSIVFRARQFSLGAEGQLLLGALASSIVCLYMPGPAFVVIPLALLAAGVIGFLWGWAPGLLKAYLKVDEIVSTLMLNVIALQFSDLLLINWLRDPKAGFIATASFPTSAVLPLVIPGTRVTLMLFVMLLAVGVGLTVGIQEADLSPRDVLLILGLGGALATYRVVLAARPVSVPVRQVGFWITLPLVAALVFVAPMFALYALAGFVEAVLLFAGLAEWLADAATSAICALAVTGGAGTTPSSWATRAALFALFLVTARLVRRVLRSVVPSDS